MAWIILLHYFLFHDYLFTITSSFYFVLFTAICSFYISYQTVVVSKFIIHNIIQCVIYLNRSMKNILIHYQFIIYIILINIPFRKNLKSIITIRIQLLAMEEPYLFCRTILLVYKCLIIVSIVHSMISY